jgi:PIN domain nuclease of toxin-antitoxin system
LRADRLLLDTHAFIWWRENSPRLGADARSAITGAAVVYVSIVTAWEAAIKTSLGKLKLPASVETGVVESGFERLPITFGHTEAVARLPFHHRDPFDRMLVAQCLTERLSLVTRDSRMGAYGVDVVWT